MPKPFERVPRLPVPPEVSESFKAISRAQKGYGLAGAGVTDPARQLALRSAAGEKLDKAVESAAKHFGGDKGKAITHFKRFVRSRGTFMGAGDIILPKSTAEEAIRKVERIRTERSPRQIRSTAGKTGRKRA